MDQFNQKPLRILMIVAALGIAVRLYVHLACQWTILDGFIGYRFAEQFSAGQGLVFNAGERISGNTSVLFTLVLGLAGCLNLPLPETARALGILADVGSFFLIWRIVSRHAQLKSDMLALTIPAMIYLFPLTLIYAVCGMETTPYVFLVLLLLERTLSRSKWSWYLSVGLLMYCRPDSVVFIAAALLFQWWDRRKLPWMEGFVTFGLGLSYLAFNGLYYGTVIPNTLLTKSIAYHDSIAENFRFIASRFFRSQILYGVFLILLTSGAVLWRQNRLVLLFAMAALAYTGFLLKAPHLRTWYVIPYLYVTLVLLATVGAKQFEKLSRPVPQLLLVILLIGYLIAAGLGLRVVFGPLREAKRYELATRAIPGEWLRTNTPPNAKIFVTALEVGYFAKRHMLDSPGLVTPQVWRMLQTNSALTLLDQAECVDADFALIPKGQPRRASFQFLQLFDCNPPSSFADMDYELFVRVRTNSVALSKDSP